MEPLGKELASRAGRTAAAGSARRPRRRECTIGHARTQRRTAGAWRERPGCALVLDGRRIAGMARARGAAHRAHQGPSPALVSLQEELEAIDWYQQRVDATEDPELKHILAHNRDEEEHASMILEWIRRRDVAFARMLKKHTGHGPDRDRGGEAEASGEADVERRGEKGKR